MKTRIDTDSSRRAAAATAERTRAADLSRAASARGLAPAVRQSSRGDEMSSGRTGALMRGAEQRLGARGLPTTPRQVLQASGVRAPYSIPAGPPLDMPRIDPAKVTVTGGTVADVEQMLGFMWANGGAGGQNFVKDLVAKINSDGMRIELGAHVPGGAQGGPGIMRFGASVFPIPADFNMQVASMMTMVHEFQHAGPDWAYAGTTYGEALAYKAGYDFMKDSLGLTNAEIRDTLGAGNPTYILGTMMTEYQITMSNAFLEMMRKIGVGGSGGLNDVIAGSNTGANSTSPNSNGDTLDTTALFEIAKDLFKTGICCTNH